MIFALEIVPQQITKIIKIKKMKKLLFALTIALSSTTFSQDIKDAVVQEGTDMAQNAVAEGGKKLLESLGDATFGIRAFGLANTSSLGDFSNVKGLGNHGFSIGLAAKVDISDNFFVTPELYYSHTGIDELSLPILFGYSILKDKLDIIAGPSLMYSFSKSSKDDLATLGEGAMAGQIDYQGLLSTFEVGYMAGLQYHLGNFMISARYQGGFSGKIVEYASQGTGVDFKESNEDRIKTAYVSLGIGFNFGGN